jgi:hypothetical protein
MVTLKQQTYRYTIPGERDIAWDVELARFLVRNPANVVTTVTLDLASQQDIAAKNEIEEAHLPKVDPSEPGIGAALYDEGHIAYVLIDGQHRNVRAMRDGVPFRVHLLTDAASRRCLIEGDDHPRMPWNL